MLRRFFFTTCALGACVLFLSLSATATPPTVNATALGATCASHGGEFDGPDWVWRASGVGYGCLFRSDDISPPWSAQAARAQAICTAAGWYYYDFGAGTTFLYGYYGWGCRA